MVTISERVEVQAPRESVWAAVSNPLFVASCIPGATLVADSSEGTYTGSIKVKFGPTAVTFNGLVTLSFDDADHRCTIEGRGRDGRGASNALATGTVVLTGSAPTTLSVDGNFEVSGPLETFARTGGVHLARALLADFAGNLERRISEQTESGPLTVSEIKDETQDQATGGFALMWHAFRSWIGSVVRGRSAL